MVVTLPARAPASDAARVLRELHGWVGPRLRALEDRRRRLAQEDPDVLVVLGEPHVLTAEDGRRRVRAEPGRLVVPSDPTERDRALARWVRGHARATAVPRLDEAATAVRRRIERVRITDTRTRWGSCSSSGTVSLSWRLVLAPEHVFDYVIWHEACHLVHAHHRPPFWALLETHRPDWRASAAWLREHGADLRLRLPAA